jgi:hypothetical protein
MGETSTSGKAAEAINPAAGGSGGYVAGSRRLMLAIGSHRLKELASDSGSAAGTVK